MNFIDPVKRWMDKVIIGDDCWEWQSPLDKGGYGRFWWNGRTGRAHRFAYETFVGPLPDELDIDHLCRNRRCVRPSHLEAVTEQVNVLRGETITAAFAIATECINGHEFDEENTRWRPSGGRTCRTCARDWARENRRRKVAA